MAADTPDAPAISVRAVPAHCEGLRADKALAEMFPETSRSRLQKIFDAGGVTSGGKTLARKTVVSAGEEIAVAFPPNPETRLVPADIPLDVLYEDEHVIAVNKAAGIVTHPGAGTGGDTLVHALLHRTRGKLALAGGEARPGVVHRLDKETSGVILFAKTDAAYYALCEKFSAREADKQYLALTDGAPDLLAGSIREPVGRHPSVRTKMCVREDGKPARTDWTVEERFGASAALVRCALHTGRTHQIRVHLAFIGHPILGDAVYGKSRSRHEGWPVPRVMLHAERLRIAHPITGSPLDLRAPLPPDFFNLAEFLRERFGSRVVRRG